METWFKKRKVVVNDDQYAVFSIFRYHERKLRDIKTNRESIGRLIEQLSDLKRQLADATTAIDSAIANASASAIASAIQEPNPIAEGKVHDTHHKKKTKKRKRRKVLATSTSGLYDTRFDLQTQIEALQKRIHFYESGDEETEYHLDSCKILARYYATRASLNEFRRQLQRGDFEQGIVSQASELERAYQEKLAEITAEFVRKFFPQEQREPVAKPAAAKQRLVDDDVLTCYDWSYDQIRNCCSPVRHYNYRRINHFREYLRQQQGQSKIYVPPECLDEIKAEIRKHYVDPNYVDYPLVKRVLKRMKGFTKFYEHAKYVTRLLNKSYRPLSIKAEHECYLCLRFAETEPPFERHKHDVIPGRKNFMSYPFVAYKLCELAGYDMYLPHFKLLKSTTLLILQDRWWELICKDLNWQAIRTTGRYVSES